MRDCYSKIQKGKILKRNDSHMKRKIEGLMKQNEGLVLATERAAVVEEFLKGLSIKEMEVLMSVDEDLNFIQQSLIDKLSQWIYKGEVYACGKNERTEETLGIAAGELVPIQKEKPTSINSDQQRVLIDQTYKGIKTHVKNTRKLSDYEGNYMPELAEANRQRAERFLTGAETDDATQQYLIKKYNLKKNTNFFEDIDKQIEELKELKEKMKAKSISTRSVNEDIHDLMEQKKLAETCIKSTVNEHGDKIRIEGNELYDWKAIKAFLKGYNNTCQRMKIGSDIHAIKMDIEDALRHTRFTTKQRKYLEVWITGDTSSLTEQELKNLGTNVNNACKQIEKYLARD